MPDGSRTLVWFSRDESRPLAFLACLRTKSNAIAALIHPKAMPVILTTRDEIELWLTTPTKVAIALQTPLADDALRIVVRGKRQEGPDKV